MAADGEAVDRGDPGLFDAVAAHVVRQRVGTRDAAQELVDEAEVALEKPHEWNAAAIEVGQIDAAADDAAPVVFRMIGLAAAYGRDLVGRIGDCVAARTLGD